MLSNSMKEGSGVKVNRQLIFDSAAQKKDRHREHIHNTPQSLKSLLDSDIKNSTNPHNQNAQHQSKNQENRVPVLNLFNQQGKNYPKIKEELLEEEHSELIEDKDDELMANQNRGNCEVQIIEKHIIHHTHQEQKVDPRKQKQQRFQEQQSNNNTNFSFPPNVKMSTINQLMNLQKFVSQKQFNDTMQQYKEPMNKSRKQDNETNHEREKENVRGIQSLKNPSNQIQFIDEEKTITHNPQYFRKLGIPTPQSAQKPKKQQQEALSQQQLQQQQKLQKLEQENREGLQKEILQEIEIEKMKNRLQNQQIQSEQMNKKAVKNAEKQEAHQRKIEHQQPGAYKLSDEEKKLIYYVWVHKNMQDFNYWIQKSKSTLTINFTEDQNIHACELILVPGKNSSKDPNSCEYVTRGGGTSKKEAKKTALERLAWLVITDDDLFWDGITGAAYIAHLKKEYSGSAVLNPVFASIDPTTEITREQMQPIFEPQLKRRGQLQNKQETEIPQPVKQQIQKQNKKIIDILKQGKIAEALDGLSELASLKPCLNFRDFCYIWSYAAHNKDLTLLKVILDVVHHRQFSKQMNQDLHTYNSAETVKKMSSSQDPLQKNINKFLSKYLKVYRPTSSENSFEQWSSESQLYANDESYYKLIKGDCQTQAKNFESISIEDFQNFTIQGSLAPIAKLPFLSAESDSNSQFEGIVADSNDNRHSKLNPFELPFFKREKRVQPAVLKENQDENLNYLSWDDINCLYQNLLYQEDPLFCLQACQLIYSYTQVDDDTLLQETSEYYRYKKLTIYEDLFESLYKAKTQIKFNQTYSGSLVYLGSNYEEELFAFRVWVDVDQQITLDQISVKEGDLCNVLDASGNNIPCIVRNVTETSGIIELKISSVVFGNLKHNLPMNQIFPNSCISKLYSVQKTIDKSKSLDALCTKISLFDPILKALVNPARSADQTRSTLLNSVSMQVQVSERVAKLREEYKLNEEQSEALKSCASNALTNVSGAKFTGKFLLTTCIIREWLDQQNNKIILKCRYESKGREFFQHFIQELSKDSPNIYAATSVALILDQKGNAESFKSRIRQTFNAKSLPKLKKALEESRVIIVCDASPSLGVLAIPFSNCQFNRVIIYEAEQHREDDCLELLVKNCNQAVFIGDFTAAIRKPADAVLSVSRRGDRSILEAVPFQTPFVLRKRYFPDQFPSANVISSLYENLFHLKSNPNYSQVTADELLIIDVKGAQECIRDDLETDFSNTYNAHEAHLSAAVVCNLIRSKQIELKSIMVVTATQTQKFKIERAALSVFHMAVKVQCINEEFKQSYDYVIYSGVISNTKGIVGKAIHSNILSTLLQHTMKQFVFVGDVSLFAANPIWRDLFKIANERRQVKVWENKSRVANHSYKQGYLM